MSDTHKLLLTEGQDGCESYAMMPPGYHQHHQPTVVRSATRTALYVLLGVAVACAIIPAAYFMGRHSISAPGSGDGGSSAANGGVDAEDLCEVAKPSTLSNLPSFSVSNAKSASVLEPLPGNLLAGRFLQCFMAVLDNKEISCVPSNPLLTSPGGGQLFFYSNKRRLDIIFSLTGPGFGASSASQDTVEAMRAVWLSVNVTISLSGQEKTPEAAKIIPFSGPYKQRYESYNFESSTVTVPLEIDVASSNGFIIELEGMDLPSTTIDFQVHSNSLPDGVSLETMPLRATGLNLAPQVYEGVDSFRISQLDSSVVTEMEAPELDSSDVVSGTNTIASLTPTATPKRRRQAAEGAETGPKPSFEHGLAMRGEDGTNVDMFLDYSQATSTFDLVFDLHHDELNKTRVAYQMTDVLFDGLHKPTDNQGNMMFTQQDYSKTTEANEDDRRRSIFNSRDWSPVRASVQSVGANGASIQLAEARATWAEKPSRQRRFSFGGLVDFSKKVGDIAGKVTKVACDDNHQFFGKAQKCACEGAQLVQGGANCLSSIKQVINDGKLDEVLNAGQICGVGVKQACAFFQDCTANPLPKQVCSFVGARRRRSSALEPARSRRSLTVTKKQLACLWNCGEGLIHDSEMKDLNRAISDFGLTTRNDVAAFLAQGSHETGGGRWMKELDGGSYLNGRTDLGNVHPGDGPKFKGAGFIQLTGRANYQAFAIRMHDPRIMEGTNYVADNYEFTSAAFWWYKNGMSALVNGGASVNQVGARVNGHNPPNGASDRKYYWDRTATCGIR